MSHPPSTHGASMPATTACSDKAHPARAAGHSVRLDTPLRATAQPQLASAHVRAAPNALLVSTPTDVPRQARAAPAGARPRRCSSLDGNRTRAIARFSGAGGGRSSSSTCRPVVDPQLLRPESCQETRSNQMTRVNETVVCGALWITCCYSGGALLTGALESARTRRVRA